MLSHREPTLLRVTDARYLAVGEMGNILDTPPVKKTAGSPSSPESFKIEFIAASSDETRTLRS
jgi:hypothetical protein